MARGQVGRPPKGTVAQAVSETAVRAFVAGRLEHRQDQEYFQELGLAVNSSAVSRAGARLLWHPPHYKPRGRRPRKRRYGRDSSSGPIMRPLRDWLHVEPPELNISTALVTLDFDSNRRQRSAYRDLRNIAGVVQVLMLVRSNEKQRYRVTALVLADGERDRERLRERLGKVAGEWAWQDVSMSTSEPAIQTWRRLARLAGRREDLLRQ